MATTATGSPIKASGNSLSKTKSDSRYLIQAYLRAVLFIAGCAAAAILSLYQWRSDDPWGRFDVFSVGVIVFGLLWAFGTLLSHRAIFQCAEKMREAAGVTYDSQMFLWIDIFAVAEMTVFLDYGHWHLVPQLAQPVLQTIGLVFYAGAAIWLIWTDLFLSRVFQGDLSKRTVMTEGPYQFVRHPRYAGLMALQFAFAIAMGSILGWCFAIGWICVNMRRVKLEEVHLRGLFGRAYDEYSARTPRFIPGMYFFLPSKLARHGED